MSNIAKGIYVFDLGGNQIGHFRTQAEAIKTIGAKAVNLTKHAKSGAVMENRWRFSYTDTPLPMPLKVTHRNISVFNLDGTFYRLFSDVTEICKHFGLSRTHVLYSLHSGGKIKFKWRLSAPDFIKIHIQVRACSPLDIPVGHVFDSFEDASRFVGLRVSRLKDLAKTGRFFMYKFKVEMDGDKIVVWVKSL